MSTITKICSGGFNRDQLEGNTRVGSPSCDRAAFIARSIDAVHAGDPLAMGRAAWRLALDPTIRTQGLMHVVAPPVSLQSPLARKSGKGDRLAEGFLGCGASVAPAWVATAPMMRTPAKRKAMTRSAEERGKIVSRLMTR